MFFRDLDRRWSRVRFRRMLVIGGMGLLVSLLTNAVVAANTNSVPTPLESESSNQIQTASQNQNESQNLTNQMFPEWSDAVGLLSASQLGETRSEAVTEFIAARETPLPTPTPSLEETFPSLGQYDLVLEGLPVEQFDWRSPFTEIAVGPVAVQFLVPLPVPAPPGSEERLLAGENDRSWPVTATGAPTGESWSEPTTYQGHGFISLLW